MSEFQGGGGGGGRLSSTTWAPLVGKPMGMLEGKDDFERVHK